MANNFSIWLDDAPVIVAWGSNEFDIWINDIPMLHSDVTTSEQEVIRRRVIMTFIDSEKL